ncbi:MAG: AraC family transcriptional regulator [Bacteroidota bacterium]
MILKHQHIKLAGRIVFECLMFQPPLKSNSSMKEEACFMHVVKGKSRLFTPKHHIEVESRDSLLMRCGRYLNNWYLNPSREPNEVVLIHFYPDMLAALFEDEPPVFLQSNKSGNPQQVLKIRGDQMIRNYIQSLLYGFEKQELQSESWIQVKLKEILFILGNAPYANKSQAILSNLFSEEQHAFKEIIQSHLYDDLTSQDLAVIAGCSLSSFKRKFKATFGSSPNRYIHQQRLLRARNLLSQTDQHISEIARDCGFRDLSYFSRSFSAFYESSPSAYRKLHARK